MGDFTLNCDIGESFSIFSFGSDERLMQLIDLANVACGFHASDFNHMREAVRLARKNSVKVGAHPSLPDLQGFGRREMAIEREELANCLIYQIGALEGFLKAEGMTLNHIKPHGALFGMAAKREPIAQAIADAALVFGVPVIGLSGSLHEQVYTARGTGFISEFYADLQYDDDGQVIVTRSHGAVDVADAVQRTRRALTENVATSISGKSFSVQAQTICVHSDTANSIELADAITAVVREANNLETSTNH